MAEYIEREAVLQALNNLCNQIPENSDMCRGLGMAIQIINAQPTADVQEVRHGEWIGYTTSAYIGSEDEYGDPRYADRKFYRCSECRYGSVVKSKLCPHCGAKMDKR